MPDSDMSDDRKSQILNAAEIVFAEKGFQKTRMDDIAEKTGLAKGTLYLYFKSKEELITASVGRFFQGMFTELDAQPDGNLSAAEAIMEFTEDAIMDYQKMLRVLPVAYEFLSLAFRNKIVKKVMQNYFKNYMKFIVPVIQRGIDSGEFRQVDAQEVAVALGSIFEGTVLLWAFDDRIVDIERHIHVGVELLLAGIQVPE